jgi:hypothetical protein
MRLVMAALGIALTVGGCASTPETRLRDEVFLDVYWTAARDCENRYRTLHVDRIALDGGLSVSADANTRIDAAGFRECYWTGVPKLVEARRAAGRAVPDNINLHPDIDID